MKNTIYLFAAILVFACTRADRPENPVIPLNYQWKFITGDNADFKNPDYDDSQWANIDMDKIWEQQGYDPYDGYAWFRTKVFIPSSLKEKSYLKDSLRIFLGKINNFDQTYLNGHLIGINNQYKAQHDIPDSNFIHAPTNYWNLERRYTLSVDDQRVLWDQENTLAVRVFDEGGQGGMYTGNQELSMTSITEYLDFDNAGSAFEYDGKDLKKTFQVTNRSGSLTLAGKFSIRAIGKLDSTAYFTLEENLKLKPNQSQTFDVYLKQLDQSVSLSYRFDFEDAGQFLESSEETPYILTPMPKPEPKINGPDIYGARPGNPFLFAIAATGDRPMQFEVMNLPDGLKADPNTGIISGSVHKKGTYEVTLIAKNSKGSASKQFTIEIGNTIALTPPLGWNSWNCWGLSVDTEKAIASAKVFKQKGLAEHGWSYINLDDGWEIPKDQEPKRDEKGKILTNEKFPDMKALGDSIHAMGLKFGIYSSPGPLTCGGYTASWGYEKEDAESWASWGVDYIKYDWCSYEQIAKDHSPAELKKPYFVMRNCLDQVDRDIVYSLCQYGMGEVWTWGAEVGGNLWRTTGDITDTWESMSGIGFSQVENAPYAKPGHWNDPDMLVVGWVGWGPNLHPTKLTPDEQYTHITLWCLLASPLLIGCDLERLDPFTLNLLTNDEVLAVNQDRLGKQATPIITAGDLQVWAKPLADGNMAAGIFNLGNKTAHYKLNPDDLGLPGTVTARDLWRQSDLGQIENIPQFTIPAHGAVMLKIFN